MALPNERRWSLLILIMVAVIVPRVESEEQSIPGERHSMG